MAKKAGRMRYTADPQARSTALSSDAEAFTVLVEGYSEAARSTMRQIRDQMELAGMRVVLEDMTTRFAPVLESIVEMRHVVPPRTTEAVARAVELLGEPLSAAFMTRALNALTDLAPRLSKEAMVDAVGQSSDVAVLMRALSEPSAIASLDQHDDLLVEAKLRGARMRQMIVAAEGGVLTVEEVAQRLGITRQAIHRKRQLGKVIGLSVGQHRYVYPTWQFTETGVLPGLEDVLAVLPLQDPWSVAAFFVGENVHVAGKRPIDELRRGNVEVVCRAAWAMGEQGAA